jgi:uncharacterized protein YkwD
LNVVPVPDFLDSLLATSAGPFTVIDLIIAIIAALFIMDGVRRGFIAGALGLGGVLGALALALRAYPVVSPYAAEWLSLPPTVADALTFTAVLTLSQLLATLVVHAALALLTPLFLAIAPLRPLERVAGAVPGLLLASVVATLALAPLRVLPVPAQWEDAFTRSLLAAEIPRRTSPYVPGLERLVNQVARTRAPHVAYHIDPDESITIPRVELPAADPVAEARMLELVNVERQRAGLRPLAQDETLHTTARLHSAEMFQLGYFSHTSPVSGDLQARLRGRLLYSRSSENIAYAPTVEAAHTGLMLSPSHRAAILTPEYTRAGIGAMNGGPNGLMFTQHFAS